MYAKLSLNISMENDSTNLFTFSNPNKTGRKDSGYVLIYIGLGQQWGQLYARLEARRNQLLERMISIFFSPTDSTNITTLSG